MTTRQAVVNGVAYVLSGEALYALDPVTRTVLWKNSALTGSSSPTYAGGTLFVQAARGEVVSIDLRPLARRPWRR